MEWFFDMRSCYRPDDSYLVYRVSKGKTVEAMVCKDVSGDIEEELIEGENRLNLILDRVRFAGMDGCFSCHRLKPREEFSLQGKGYHVCKECALKMQRKEEALLLIDKENKRAYSAASRAKRKFFESLAMTEKVTSQEGLNEI